MTECHQLHDESKAECAAKVCDDCDASKPECAAKVCDDCERTSNVLCYCTDCKANICDGCRMKRLHRKHKIVTRHNPEVIIEIKEPGREFCASHPGQTYVTFCSRCKTPCCPVCISEEHDQHPMTGFDSAAKAAAETLTLFFENLEFRVLPVVKFMRDSLMDEAGNYNRAVGEASDASKQRFRELREHLDRMENRHMEYIHSVSKKDLNEIDRKRAELERKLAQIEKVLAENRQAVNDANCTDLFKLASTIPDIEELVPAGFQMSGEVYFVPSHYKIPPVKQSMGMIQKTTGREIKCSVELMKKFDPTMLEVEIQGTMKNSGAHSILHGSDGVWICDNADDELILLKRDSENVTVDLDFAIFDMALSSSGDVIATDYTNACIVRVSRSGTVQSLCCTYPFQPLGVCVTNRGEVVVGLRRNDIVPKLLLLVLNSDCRSVVNRINTDSSHRPLFQTSIYQVKQNGNGDFVVADYDRVLCLNREGQVRWVFDDQDINHSKSVIFGVVCDSYQNVLIAEFYSNTVSILNGRGQYIRSLLCRVHGIHRPWTLSLDREGILWIGQEGNVKLIQYVK